MNRRDCLKLSALAGASGLLPAGLLNAALRDELITRAVPKTGEKLPIVGLGSSATFREVAETPDADALSGVLEAMLERGGTVFDTAPGYGASEEVAGRIVQDLGAKDKIFWATKVNVAGRGGGKADPAAARAQVEQSFAYIGKDPSRPHPGAQPRRTFRRSSRS